MPEQAEFLGAFMRWILKGFKTKLKDELDGNLMPITRLSYDFENMILGYISASIIIVLIVWIAF